MPYCLYLRKSRADLGPQAKGEMETLSYGDSTAAYATGELLRDYATNLIDFYRTIDLQGLSMRCIAFGVEFNPLSSGDYGISFTFEYVHA